MVSKSSIKKFPQSNLNSASLGELAVTLDEKNEALFSGGAKEKFVRTKPHVGGIYIVNGDTPIEG
jgi:hypothetical protein